MNTRGQTRLNLSKQFQIENFVKTHNIDILNCQEINVENDSFSQCRYLTSSYEIISNNATNKYGTCSLVKSCLDFSNIKMDTEGRVIFFDVNEMTFGNVYLPSGNDPENKIKR